MFKNVMQELFIDKPTVNSVKDMKQLSQDNGPFKKLFGMQILSSDKNRSSSSKIIKVDSKTMTKE